MDRADENRTPCEHPAGPARSWRAALARLTLRPRPLWRQMRGLARWLEEEGFVRAAGAGEEVLSLAIDPAGAVHPPERLNLASAPPPARRLGAFLRSIGVEALHLDTRLERGQITDILARLWSHRRVLRAGPADALGTDPGVRCACTLTSIRNATLCIRYSYCPTRFSRLVRWFKGGAFAFTDHRALFHAAPRLALLAAAIVTVPLLIFALGGGAVVLTAVTVAGAVAEFALVYLFFMTVGSQEYDNEEKSRRLRRAYDRLGAYARRIGEDLRRARGVQQRFLPDPGRMPMSDRIAWAARFAPADQVGGDTYDAMQIAPGRVAILFSDVSGHGMAAAFITAILKTAFRAWLEERGSLGEFVARLNRRLADLIPDDSFAAAFVAVYDAPSGRLSYINGGHNPEPWLIPADPSRPIVDLSEGRATVLGVIDPIPIRPAAIDLAAGDTVVFVTDGVIEAVDGEQRQYGYKRLEALLDNHRRCSPEELVGRIVDDVRAFADGAAPLDDQTLLAFRIRPRD